MPRTNIAVDEQIALDLANEANRENKNLYALTNEALSSILRVCKYGGAPRDVYPAWSWSRILRDTDAIPVPGEFMEELIKKVYTLDKDWLLKRWFEEGRTVGSYLHMHAEEIKTLATRVEELQAFLPVRRIEFEKSEADGKAKIAVRLIGAGFSSEATICTEQFILGILSVYPYRVESSVVHEGMIEVKGEEDKGHKF